VKPEPTRQVIGITVRRHWAAALGVLIVHAIGILALLQERRVLVRPETVTTVLLINMPQKEATPDLPKPPTLAPIKTHLVFDAPPVPDVVEMAEPSVALSTGSISSTAPVASPTSAGPVSLADELAVFCPSRTPPAYPPQSRHLREQGEVTLRVELDEHGQVTEAGVIKSSGYARLDAAGRSAVMTWRCNPVLRDGKPARAIAIQSLEFVLERR
jgi:protein TonB